MTDLIARVSDGRVQQAADSITLVNGCYNVTIQGVVTHEPVNSFSFPVTLVTNVSNVPADLVGGWNYNYVSGAFVSSGVQPPAPPAPPFWPGKMAIPTATFIPLVVGIITPNGWSRIETDDGGSWVFAAVMANDIINPNGIDPITGQNPFAQAIGYLETTNAKDGQPFLTPTQVSNLKAAWP